MRADVGSLSPMLFSEDGSFEPLEMAGPCGFTPDETHVAALKDTVYDRLREAGMNPRKAEMVSEPWTGERTTALARKHRITKSRVCQIRVAAEKRINLLECVAEVVAERVASLKA